MVEFKDPIRSIFWEHSHLVLLDQRKIPSSKEYINIQTLEETYNAIKEMVVRGAPAIAITGLFGIALHIFHLPEKPTYNDFQESMRYIISSRPTAVNLKLAMDSLIQMIPESIYESLDKKSLFEKLESIVVGYFNQDLDTNLSIQKNGLTLFDETKTEYHILTHCNTGALATAGIGTALGVIRGLRDRGHKVVVYADETRPYHQGSRLTAWEMEQEEIECFIIADNMAGWLLKNKNIDAVIVGADRIAANGDTANKIGTYPLSIVAKEHNVPFYVCASKTSFDFSLDSGDGIQIEMRDSDELTQNSFLRNMENQCYIPEGVLAPKGAKALNPSFDITPASNITAIVTEKGVIKPINKEKIRYCFL